jgi:hypothetical protein
MRIEPKRTKKPWLSLVVLKGESGRGLPHSKTLRDCRKCRKFRQVLDCASPLALLHRKSIHSRLKIAVVDETKREPKASVTLYQPNETPPDHRVVAFISAEGNAEDEGRIVNMMLEYAKHVGASGIALLRNEKPDVKAEVNVPSIYERPGRRIFRANVILAK